MPILIILLFYINDLVRIKRYYSQTEFVGQQIANIIQNISQQRASKSITQYDLKYAFCTAYLSIYPGTSRFWIGSGTELVHRPEMLITYIQGEANGKASSKWSIDIYTNGSGCNKPVACGLFFPSDHLSFVTRGSKTNVAPSDIHPLLKINPGETKIIIETVMFYGFDFKDNNGYEPHSIRKAFNCLLTDIKSKTNSGNFFISTVIFTPKPGLFSETPPS
jgi:hypothetical protein